jgi:hypothetical protein
VKLARVVVVNKLSIDWLWGYQVVVLLLLLLCYAIVVVVFVVWFV